MEGHPRGRVVSTTLTADGDIRTELIRVKRVSDMLCSSHAELRDRYTRRAVFSDLAILAISTWLIAVAFVDPALNVTLTPFSLDSRLWIGLLAIGSFFIAIIQLKTNWRGCADAHGQTSKMYAQAKRECVYLLRSGTEIDAQASRSLFSRYDNIGSIGISIPEKQFLSLKRKHHLKIEISRFLDTHPGAWPVIAYWRIVLRDNKSKPKKK
jgi:hypothetical protein